MSQFTGTGKHLHRRKYLKLLSYYFSASCTYVDELLASSRSTFTLLHFAGENLLFSSKVQLWENVRKISIPLR